MSTRTSPALLSASAFPIRSCGRSWVSLVDEVRQADEDGEAGATPEVRRPEPTSRADERETDGDAREEHGHQELVVRRQPASAPATSHHRGSSRSSARSTQSVTRPQATRSGAEVSST